MAGAIAAVLWQTMNEPVRGPGKARASLGNALLYLVALIFVASGVATLSRS